MPVLMIILPAQSVKINYKNMRYLFILLLLLASFSQLALADTSTTNTTTSQTTVSLENPLKSDNPLEIVGYIIRTMLGVLGAAALLMFVYGGFLWMFSGGSEEKVKKGRQIFVWAVLGMAVILSSYSILNFIFTRFTKI